MAARVHSDADVLSRSLRSRIALLVLLIAIGLAAAVWTGTRKTGSGAPEDRQRLMIVTADQSAIDYFKLFEPAGFLIEVERFSTWESEARAALPDSEAEGPALLLELADERGIALVVFEQPATIDFAGLELEPAIAEVEQFAERDYAAISVGDYGFPHQLSVDEPGEDPRVRVPGYGALEAVFRQALIGARKDLDRPTVEELQFEHTIRFGREMIAGPLSFDGMITAARATVDATLADGSGALALVPALETGTAIPTPDGGVLVVHHALDIYSSNARYMKVEAGPTMELAWLGPDALAKGVDTGAFELQPCTSLAGGVLALADDPQVKSAADGSAVAIGSRDGSVIVWRKTDAPGCEWEAIADLDEFDGVQLAPLTDHQRDPGDRLLAAKVRNQQDRAQLLVWTDAAPTPQVIFEQTQRWFGVLAFIENQHVHNQHVALVSDVIQPDGEPPRHEYRIYVVDRMRPGVYLSVPVEFFAEARDLRELVALAAPRSASSPELLVSAVNEPGRFELVRLQIASEAWAAFLEADEPGMVSLLPEQLDAVTVTEVDSLFELGVGPSPWVAYGFREGVLTSELALFDLDSRTTRRLTDNLTSETLPRFTADGRYLTFVSTIQINLSATRFTVPRLLALDSNQ